MSIISIPLSKLREDPQNVRHPAEGDLAAQIHDMQASLLEHGQLSPLLVRPMKRPKGAYQVLAGGRRLRAFQGLARDGRIPADHDVDCSVRDVGDAMAHELSAVENIVRVALKPTEEFRLFAELAAHGASDEDIARRFGIEIRVVQQRQRLGRLHPEIFEALDRERISLDLAKAYASTEEQALQLRVFRELGAGYNHYAHNVRNAIRGGSSAALTEQMLEVVGEKAYLDAGGQLEHDLFEGGRRVVHRGTLEELYYAKLEQQQAALAAKLPEGVAIVTSNIDIGRSVFAGADYSDEQRDRLTAIDKRSDEIGEQLEALADWAPPAADDDLADEQDSPLVADRPEDQEKVDALRAELDGLEVESEAIHAAATPSLPEGPIVAWATPSADGMRVRGYYRPAGYVDAAGGSDAPAASLDRPIGLDNRIGYGDPNPAVKAEHGLTVDAIEVMRAHRRMIMRGKMAFPDTAQRDQVPIDYLVFSLLRLAVEKPGLNRDYAADLGVAQGAFLLARSAIVPGLLEEVAAQEVGRIWSRALEQIEQAPWFLEKDLAAAFAMFCELDRFDRAEAARVAAALMLDRSLCAPGYRVPVHDKLMELIGADQDDDVRRVWQPDAAFFERLPKSRRLAAVAEVNPIVAKRIGALPTSEISAACERFFRGDAASRAEFGHGEGTAAYARRWLPAFLRFTDADPRKRLVETIQDGEEIPA